MEGRQDYRNRSHQASRNDPHDVLQAGQGRERASMKPSFFVCRRNRSDTKIGSPMEGNQWAFETAERNQQVRLSENAQITQSF